MVEIITTGDLPIALQSNELIGLMIAGANANASRVAPCLIPPTDTAWAAATAFAVGDMVMLAENQYLKATVAGTSAVTAPIVPTVVGGTVIDGTVTWARIAPTPDQIAEAKLLLVGMIQRWVEAGSGAMQSQTAGPFGMTVDTRQKSSGFRPWPSEIKDLEAICADPNGDGAGAYTVDTLVCATGLHADWCSLAFGATFCSCGVDIAGEPIFYESPC